MAGEDGPNPPALGREERVAAEVIRRFELAPPIDVEAVIRRFADLDEAAIPGACDGLVLYLHGPRPRPLVLLQRWQVAVRRRFTMAHELGHILLPWHVADGFLCETKHVRVFADPRYAGMVGYNAEPEANRFAAELLVPTAWLTATIQSEGLDRLGAVLDQVRSAEVSAYVACIRLQAVLPSGYAYVVSRGDSVVLSGQTSGTGVYPPSAGEPFERKRLDAWAHDVVEADYGPTHVTWWTFVGERQVPDHASDPRDAPELLDALLDRHAGDAGERRKIGQSLAGVVGYAYGEAKREGRTSSAELYPRFRGRFAKARDLPEALLEDDEFDLWLHKRAEQLAQ